MIEYKYRLARWNERDKSLRCPRCGRGRGSFKEYLLEDGTPVDAVGHTCGLCDHTSSCGYHLPPNEYYKMNPDERKDYTSQAAERKPKKRIEIDVKLANKARTCYEINSFVRWARSLTWSEEQATRLEMALELYNVGTTKDGGTIWWQIDEEYIVRTGKKMRYGDDGHRLKDKEGNAVGMNWIHAMMKFNQDEYELVQCLFGEHLLKVFPDAVVCVVESEKTAILMSAYDSEAFKTHIWLATGGKYNIQEMKLYPLRNRKVLLYPDKDAVEDWRERIKDIPYKDLIMYDSWIKNVWKPEDGEKADIGDSMLRLIRPAEADLDKAFPGVRELFDLEIINVSKYNGNG